MPIEKVKEPIPGPGEVETDFVVKPSGPVTPQATTPAPTEPTGPTAPVEQQPTAPTAPTAPTGEPKPIVQPPKQGTDSDLASDEMLPGMKPTESIKKEEAIPGEEEEEEKPVEVPNPLELKEEESDQNEPGKSKPGEPIPVDYIRIGTDLGIEVKENTHEALKLAHSQAIEAAKKVTVPDLSSFNDQQKILFDWVGNGGTLEDFFKPLKAYDDFLVQPDDEKIIGYLMSEKGMKEEDARKEVDRLIDDDKFDEEVQKLDASVHALRNKKYDSILATIKKATEDSTNLVAVTKEREKTELVKTIDEMNDFMGIPIPDTTKAIIKKEIDTGKFTKMNDNAKVQVLARYLNLFGDKVVEYWQTKMKEAENSAYNRGIKGYTERLHNIPPTPEPIGTQIKPKGDEKSPIGDASGIDKDAVDGYKGQ